MPDASSWPTASPQRSGDQQDGADCQTSEDASDDASDDADEKRIDIRKPVLRVTPDDAREDHRVDRNEYPAP